MKYYIETDEDGYITFLTETGTEKDTVEFNYDETKLLNCYKLIDDEVIFDEEKYNRLVNKQSKEQEIIKLKHELSTYDYIGVKISMGVATKEEYAEQIAYTESLREKIRDLESQLVN